MELFTTSGRVAAKLCTGAAAEDGFGEAFWRRRCITVETVSGGTTQKRTVRWLFEELETLRRTLIARAGRLTRPQGKLTLTLNANPTVQNSLLRFLQA